MWCEVGVECGVRQEWCEVLMVRTILGDGDVLMYYLELDMKAGCVVDMERDQTILNNPQ